jgi:putative Mn2+ efflux pump MntP
MALGADAFAVSVCVSATLANVTARHTFRLVWHFGLFQSMMTFFGWAGGEGLSLVMAGFNYWIAFGILVFLGIKMIYESFDPEGCAEGFDPTRGWSLVGLSIATSLDALAVGVTFSLIGMSVWVPALVIGLTALIMSFVGTRIGKRAGTVLGQWAERVGGVVLILIGSRILLEHLGR